jgi:hypothetical protein
MTDELAPPPAPTPPAPASPVQPPPDMPAPTFAPAGKPSRNWRPILIVGAIIVVLGVVLFAVRNNKSADDLKVGDCFNIPSGDEIETVEAHPCGEAHTGEIFLVTEYDGTETSYPVLGFDSFVDTACTPAYESYVGRAIDDEPQLSVGYFYPTRDGWSGGDRTITCYLSQADESVMTQSVKAP